MIMIWIWMWQEFIHLIWQLSDGSCLSESVAFDNNRASLLRHWAISSPIIKSTFHYDGQIDELNEMVPDEEALLGTYCGYIGKIKKVSQWKNKKHSMWRVDIYCDSTGEVANINFEISCENCQHMKILSCQKHTMKGKHWWKYQIKEN